MKSLRTGVGVLVGKEGKTRDEQDDESITAAALEIDQMYRAEWQQERLYSRGIHIQPRAWSAGQTKKAGYWGRKPDRRRPGKFQRPRLRMDPRSLKPLIGIYLLVLKVHLFLLPRDKDSVFHDILAMPAGAGVPQGFDPSNPIVLAGDTLVQIRACRKVAYAKRISLSFFSILSLIIHHSPLQTQIEAYRPGDVVFLSECGLFAHKYAMSTFVELALRGIQTIIVQHPESFRSVPIDLTTPLLRPTWIRGPEEYKKGSSPEFVNRDAIRKSWIAQLEAQPSFPHMAEVLDIADQYDCRSLLGDVYYLFLCEISRAPHEPNNHSGASSFPYPALPDRHRARIMTGYWSLTEFWQKISVNIPPPPRKAG
ncbi:hypothetical protein DFH09DRAFT_1278125 [Mycena vulgaris]|nr:hypothetical protein DFH09DRAFT_1278125 [Mycena vulgaris]